MSQRNRPGSAQALAEQQRMPLAAAEALLWGKRTHGEHVVLNARMQELEEQHRAYNSRIQATETISEAAEAATARIRRIEHQVAAIESDEQDRPFDKWVEGEVADFKVFVERNKTVRQKQVELETKISGIEDSIDKVIDTFPDIEILLERIGRLESERLKDANQIKKLEADVAKLKIRRQTQVIEVARARPEVTPRPIIKHMLPPPSAQLFAEPEDAAEETEDKEILPIFPTVPIEQERFPHPSSLKTISK
jgi:DNA repair exonuclease SbcCD ATPase subunit